MRKFVFAIGAMVALWAVPASAQLAGQAAADSVPAAPPVQAPAPVPMPPPPPAANKPVQLTGSFLYVYSFLDIREGEFTEKVLNQLDADLTARLQGMSIDSKILRYSEARRNPDEFVAESSFDGSDNRSVPVIQTIVKNLSDERNVQARFRLIMFPSFFGVYGAWRHYTIRFDLMDTRTNRRLMRYDYSGRHMVMLSNSENAAARSKKILDKLFEQLKVQGLI